MKESTLGVLLTAVGVTLTGAIFTLEVAKSLAGQGGVPIAQVQPEAQLLPGFHAGPSWNDLHRQNPAMFGGITGFGDVGGGGNFKPGPPNPRVTGPNMFGGAQGQNTGAASGTQYSGTTDPLITGTRYGKLLGLNAGKRFVYHQPLHGAYAQPEPDPVPIY